MNNLLLSFIIPIYQVEDFVEDCLYSICKQNVNGNDWFEIICVNDGSKDKSLEVVNRVTHEFPNIRFKVIDKENEGVSVARNMGIDNSEGQYIWFVDSDDVILQNSLELFYKYIRDNEYEVVSGLFFQTQDIKITLPTYKGKNKNQKAFCSSCIKRQLLVDNEIVFTPGVAYGEDLLFFEMVNFFAKSKLELDDVVYAYRQRSGSAMNNQNGGKKYIDSLEKRLAIYCELTESYREGETYFGDLRDGVVRNIMLYHLRAQDKSANIVLKELREKQVYPYPLRFKDLIVYYALPDFMIKLFCFYFPFPWYYRLMSKLYSLTKNK